MAEWVVEGYCNKCGECCRILMRMSYMLSSKNLCKYLQSDNLCEIREAYETGDEDFFKLISSLELEYFHEECKEYPDSKNPAHTPPRHQLLEICGYKVRRSGQ